MGFTSDRYGSALPAEDQVALGDCSPRAPTDPYVPTLEHTVPQIMVSLREAEAWNELRVREQAGSDGAMRRISASDIERMLLRRLSHLRHRFSTS